MEDQISEKSEKIPSKRRSSSRLFMIVAIFMLATVLLCLVVTIIIAVVLAVKTDKSCESNECHPDLKRVLNWTDDAVDPCEDFHRFSCGRYNDPSHSTFMDTVVTKLQDDLQKIIVAPLTSDDPPSLAMAKSFYQSCVQIEFDERERDMSFYVVLHSLGGWPIVNGSSWDENSFDWWKTASICAEIGIDFDWFIDIDVEKYEDDNVHILYVGYPITYMNYLEDEEMIKYSRLMEDIAIFMGAPIESVGFEVEKTIEFQKELYKITREANDKEKLRLGKPLNYRVIDLQNQMPEIQWVEFLHNTTGRIYRFDDIVNVNSMTYLRNLRQLLLRTPKRFQADYIIMKVIEKFWPYLSNTIIDLYENYQRDTVVNYTPLNRTKACVEETMNKFIGVADAVYIRDTVDAQIKREVKELVATVRYNLVNHLNSATWLDEEGKKFATENITELFEYVGGPDEVFDVEKYERKLGYFGFEGMDLNIIDKITQLKKLSFKKKFGKIGSPIDDTDTTPELVIDQIYEFQKGDSIPEVVPAGVLRYEFYDLSRPEYANYGTLVSLISYKLTHTFSESLHKYLKAMERTQWWGNSLDMTNSRKCFPVDDLVDYYIVQTNNGAIRIEKHFLDNLAFDLAFEAYIQWVKQHRSEAVHSKYKYSANQFFWIFSMQLGCATDSETNEEIHNEHHDRGNRHIINSYYFANVFKCPPNTGMNPEEKCQIV